MSILAVLVLLVVLLMILGKLEITNGIVIIIVLAVVATFFNLGSIGI